MRVSGGTSCSRRSGFLGSWLAAWVRVPGNLDQPGPHRRAARTRSHRPDLQGRRRLHRHGIPGPRQPEAVSQPRFLAARTRGGAPLIRAWVTRCGPGDRRGCHGRARRPWHGTGIRRIRSPRVPGKHAGGGAHDRGAGRAGGRRMGHGRNRGRGGTGDQAARQRRQRDRRDPQRRPQRLSPPRHRGCRLVACEDAGARRPPPHPVGAHPRAADRTAPAAAEPARR